jgi:hypothetical protein
MVLCFTIGKKRQSCYLIQDTLAVGKPGQTTRIGCDRVGQINNLRENRSEAITHRQSATPCQEDVIKLFSIFPDLTQVGSQFTGSDIQSLSR